MREPRRLLDGEADGVELALLRSAIRDAPGRKARRRTAAALGIAAGASGASATAAAAELAAAGTAGGGAAVGTTAGWAGIGVFVRWIGIAAVGGGAVLGAVDQVLDSGAAASGPAAIEAAASPVEGTGPTNGVAATGPASPLGTEASRGSEEGERVVSSAEGSDRAGSARSSASEASDGERARRRADDPCLTPDECDAGLGAEVRALDNARAALRDGRPEAALRALSRYQARFPSGSLGPEADVVRIEALLAMGRTTEAHSLAERYLDHHGDSPAARHVRSLITSEDGR